MLTKVEAVSASGDVLALPLNDASSGYLVKDIEGLDPVKAAIVSSAFAQLDGSQYQTSRRENRNIVLKLGLEDDYGTADIRTLRSRLYKFFMPKSLVTLKFYIDESHFASITGRVESAESPLFVREPEMVISIICFDPNFVAPSSVLLNGQTVTGGTELAINYLGTEPTGFVLKMTMNHPVTTFTIYNRPEGGEFIQFEFAALLSVADTLEISTVAGNKYATLTRAGTPRSILYGVSPAANWLNFTPGLNAFRVVTEGQPIPYTIEYRAKYGGL